MKLHVSIQYLVTCSFRHPVARRGPSGTNCRSRKGRSLQRERSPNLKRGRLSRNTFYLSFSLLLSLSVSARSENDGWRRKSFSLSVWHGILLVCNSCYFSIIALLQEYGWSSLSLFKIIAKESNECIPQHACMRTSELKHFSFLLPSDL